MCGGCAKPSSGSRPSSRPPDGAPRTEALPNYRSTVWLIDDAAAELPLRATVLRYLGNASAGPCPVKPLRPNASTERRRLNFRHKYRSACSSRVGGALDGVGTSPDCSGDLCRSRSGPVPVLAPLRCSIRVAEVSPGLRTRGALGCWHDTGLARSGIIGLARVQESVRVRSGDGDGDA